MMMYHAKNPWQLWAVLSASFAVYCVAIARALDNEGSLVEPFAALVVFVTVTFFFARTRVHHNWHQGRIAILWALPIAGFLFHRLVFLFLLPIFLGAAIVTWYWLPERKP